MFTVFSYVIEPEKCLSPGTAHVPRGNAAGAVTISKGRSRISAALTRKTIVRVPGGKTSSAAEFIERPSTNADQGPSSAGTRKARASGGIEKRSQRYPGETRLLSSEIGRKLHSSL